MDGAEGWRVIRCAGGGAEDKTIINRIMLRFRPIAPKLPSGDQNSGNPSKDKMGLLGSKLRTKRKYVRVAARNNVRCKRNKKASPDQEKEAGACKNGVTLQLLPERNDGFEVSGENEPLRCNLEPATGPAKKGHANQENHHQEAHMLFKAKQPVIDGIGGLDQAVVPQKRGPVESWVTVECVTEVLGIGTCKDAQRLGYCTDVERVRLLGEDTCPGFVSDGSSKVVWVNGAFKRMVNGTEAGHENNTTTTTANLEEEEQSLDIMVSLVVKDELLAYFSMYSAFTCWVRLKYTWQQVRCLNMVPCDVWRMDFGGFAWRLDVEAALSLGR
ncbi:hypothetical protein Tsubulata_043417 [Turnera subulata]|uniref:DUF7950 domain-containing protein n=1 Tax=Turnera subulata TaxID=218843 RepID=A0A9Q0F1K1_9ROSI|nr:hypothetical protein Tsubulata_043417 [Turnera subulata]